MSIESEIFKCSLLTNSFKLEDVIWHIEEIRRHIDED
jgi:hypothetical protein